MNCRNTSIQVDQSKNVIQNTLLSNEKKKNIKMQNQLGYCRRRRRRPRRSLLYELCLLLSALHARIKVKTRKFECKLFNDMFW